jgi:hypothetical protein
MIGPGCKKLTDRSQNCFSDPCQADSLGSANSMQLDQRNRREFLGALAAAAVTPWPAG